MDNTKLKGRMIGKVQELQQPTENQNITITSAPETAPAPVESTYLALTNNALDIIRANLKSQPLTLDLFDIVKSPSGGSTVFEVPGLAGNEAAMELTGIVLDYTTPRAYWDTPDPVEGTPPVCMSQNSIISHDGKSCAMCPYNDFGSKDGDSNAKACKESVLLFPAAAQQHHPPAGACPCYQQAPVSEILYPSAEYPDADFQCGHEDHLGEGHQQTGQTLRPVQFPDRQQAQPGGSCTGEDVRSAVHGNRERRSVGSRFGRGQLR